MLPHEQVLLDEADLVAASDHRPVWVDFELDPAPRGAGEAENDEAAGGQVSEAVVSAAEQRADEAVQGT